MLNSPSMINFIAPEHLQIIVKAIKIGANTA
ncbi:hypothetical protein EBT31_09635 [bacterium]|nr:hypothetical protein [bacterium]